ncbi:glycosyltransferase [Actinoplanes sp. NPDC051851]|uniref:glycosyltransferase n=1 Tax=Actinoplanes sp. NPDC051851 TaxID=3154753 RepID=UPI00343CC775
MSGVLVVCAGTNWDGVAGSDRMLATCLSAYTDVLWVDPPTSMVRAGGLPRPKLGTIGPRMHRLTPLVLPMHTRTGVRHTTPALVRAQIRWALRSFGVRPHTVLDCRLGGMLGGWGDGVRGVLYGTDDFVAGAELMGRSRAQVEAEERVAIDRSDLVLAVSPILRDRWSAMGAEVLLLPNGVRTETYDGLDGVTPAADVRLPGPVAGVCGHLSERIDIGLLEAVVDEGLSLLLVGPYDSRWEPERFQALTARDRVQWTGPRPYERMPSYMRHLDVGLTPYTDTAFNRASFPLKTLEYLAAGLPVVSTDLPATRWLSTGLVTLATEPADFAKAARAAAEQARTAEVVATRRAFADEHSWRARAATVATALGLTG